MAAGKLFNPALLATFLLCTTAAGCGQSGRPEVSKAQALRDVKVNSVDGWKEARSDEGRFRVLFPGEPRAAEEGSLRGFRFSAEEGRNWFAYYTDTGRAVENDLMLRELYRQSIDALTRRGAKLTSSRDVTLHGVPGAEFILVTPDNSARSYMRVFQVGRRIYTLTVDDRSGSQASNESVTPAEVSQFFDSFTFWVAT